VFTWGVLDRLLVEDWLGSDGISGTSAGAMNAAVMTGSHAHGGADRVKAVLEAFCKLTPDTARGQNTTGFARRRPQPPTRRSETLTPSGTFAIRSLN